VVLDAAHNAASIAALVETLDESFSARRRLLVFATTQEKDLRGMLQCLRGRFDHVIFTRYLNNPRGVPPEELQALAATMSPLARPTGEGPGVRAAQGGSVPLLGTSGVAPPVCPQHCWFQAVAHGLVSMEIAPTPADAWDAACRLAKPDDLICVTGSFFLAAEMRRQIVARPLCSSNRACCGPPQK
jgi:dihydrofolate synthase/folylpolyglutamate synthase